MATIKSIVLTTTAEIIRTVIEILNLVQLQLDTARESEKGRLLDVKLKI